MYHYLTIKGFHGEVEEEKLFNYLANEERLELVATERCVEHYSLTQAVNAELRKHQDAKKANRYDPPSVIWEQLFMEGAEALLSKYRADPATDVPGALTRSHKERRDAGSGDDRDLRAMIDAYTAEEHVFLYGGQEFVVIHGCLCHGGTWDKKGGIFEHGSGCLTDLEHCWGLPYDATCFLFAAYAARLRGHTILIDEVLERVEKFLRNKVWLIDNLTDVFIGKPVPESIMEQATEIVYNHKR